MKFLQWGLALLFAVALLAAAATHLALYRQTGIFQQWLFYLLAADAVLIGLLFIAVGGLVVRQWRAWRRGERGARLSLRLTFLFWGMSLLPAVLLYSLSFGTVFRGIDLWYDTPLGSAFERSIAFGRNVIGGEFKRLEYAARDIAGSSRAQSGRLAAYLGETQLLYQLDGIALYDAQGRLSAAAGAHAGAALPPGLLRRLAQEGLHLHLQGSGQNRAVQVAVPLLQAGAPGALWLARALPPDIAAGLVEVERGQQEYEKLQVLRSGLRWSFILTMSISLALILFALGWLSLWLGRSMTRPLVRLSAAAEAVGGGDFDRHLREAHPLEEVSHLNHAFNVMAQRLKQSHQERDDHQKALEKASAYEKNLVASLATGVLTFSAGGRLLRFNAAAEAFLNPPQGWEDKTQLPDTPLCRMLAAAADTVRKGKGGARAEERMVMPDGEVLLVRAAPLPERAGGGVLMIIDDISRPLRAEREATWEEASRRFAHEIKNPLTPIQLAAERLEAKLAANLPAADAEMLRRLVEMIVGQVGAMRLMVDSFRDYAGMRASAPLARMQLNDLLRDVLFFYENRVQVRRALQQPLPEVRGDKTTLRQLLINLLNNAQEALAGKADAMIAVRTAADGDWVELTIEDNGGGVPPERLKKIGEPYETSKPQGTGLGLPMVRKIVEEHGGAMEIENGECGLRVCVRLHRH